MKDEILNIWFQLAVGISNRIVGEIVAEFGSVNDIYSCENFSFLGKDKEKYIKRLESKDVSEAFEVAKKCKACGASVIGYYDEGYPAKFKKLKNPPAVIYAIGELKNTDNLPCTAIVGTRSPTESGKSVVEAFSYVLAASGVAIVSGLAKGIDVCAHRGCIAAEGYTVAVLGCPIDEIYPAENEKAFKTLYRRGAVISEMYPGCPRTRADFPNRNRLISALSDVVVIGEAGEKSGALITANCAVEQGKKLFAIPGPVSEHQAGNNALIKSGASMLTEPYDIISYLLNEYPEKIQPYEPSLIKNLLSYGISAPRYASSAENTAFSPPAVTPEKELSKQKNSKREKIFPESVTPLGKQILLLLGEKSGMTSDDISSKLGVSASDVLSELTMLEIDELINSSVGGRYSLT